VAQGVDGVIAAALLRETAERLERGTRLDVALAGALGAAPPAATPSVRLFFGPPGDGKTTTIAKLAAQARRAGRRVLLVGADTYRIGAAAELERYGQALGAEVRRAKDPAELGHALRDHGRADLVLIDTAGAGPAQQAELAEVKALADAAGADAGRTLVVSAATGALAAAHTWRAFAALGPDACVLTKADTAPGGPIVAQLWRERVPVSHVAAGRRIPDDLEAATPKRLVRCLLAA
jgi:flagellar biosynthesis protein FlhF